MQHIPPHLKPYFAKAKKIYVESSGLDITFSGPTYQVRVIDPATKQEYWTFLQLDSNDEVGDSFCSCEESEKGGCLHLAVSILALFDHHSLPLHKRFAASFWNALGHVWMKRYGDSEPQEGWEGISFSDEGEKTFQLLGMKSLLETEENSLKFSNLSEEEIEAWREGHPSTELLFELSFWSDFAKQLMIYSEKNPVSVTFQSKAGALPHELEIQSKDFKIVYALDQEDLEALIPTLNTAQTNLKTYNRLQDFCKAITFDPKIGAFHFELNKDRLKGKALDGWQWVAKVGFFPTDFPFSEVLEGEEVEPFLEQYFAEMGPLMKGAKLHLEPSPLRYHLEFDPMWSLLIEPYISQAHDLEDRHTWRWGPFTYLPEKGFYKVKREEIPDLPRIVLENDLPDFVRNFSFWLNKQPGFEVHLGSVEAQVSYQIDKQGALTIQKNFPVGPVKRKEFGLWIYVEGEGFYQKSSARYPLPLDLNVPLRADLVAGFIRTNLVELELVPKFFAAESPFENIYLEVSLDEKERILVEPHYDLKPQYKEKPHRLYEDWVYVEGEGFSEIPPSMRLPEKAKEPFWVASKDVAPFMNKEIFELKPWIQKIAPELTPPGAIQLVLDSLEEGPFHSWILQVHYQTDRGVIPFSLVYESAKKRKPFVFSENGLLDLLQDRFLWLKRLRPEAVQRKGKSVQLQLSTIELLRLHAFEEMMTHGETLKLFTEVIDLKRSPPFDCKEMQGHLRPYQEIGARWLFTLYSYLLGGLLCDEMGLGKTHQSMALMASVRTLRPAAKFLVVCPTSVLYHWEDRLQEFFPTMKILTFHGPFRKAPDDNFSLLLTSYGITRTETEWFSTHRFDVAVYDEIQVAKNHRSKLYSALQQVKADVKIGLTGTPIENQLRELKTLFDLVLPGYMPSETDYNHLIVRPIEKQGNLQQKGFLHRLIHPFVLRRRKQEVLTDLPSKTEELAHCDLAHSQERLYREVLLLHRDDIVKELFNDKKGIPYLHVFALLARLKQVCDHPALFHKTPEEYHKYHSGKWDLFVELLAEARDSGQKVVVYSQYLGMLDIIEKYLEEQGVGFASLRGSTVDRKGQISKFANDPSCEVFVASLKAAGLGIDLTAGSVVIHYDRWWNAARENQATDRVHRIGQSRGVQVFKLVTKNTFEERIHQIIERKKELMESSIGVDDHEVLKTFTREELFQLLQMGEG